MAKKSTLRTPLILTIWPFVALFLTFAGYAVANYLMGADDSNVILNVVLFVIGVGAVTLGLPSFIVGLILLITRLTGSGDKPVAKKAASSQSNGLSVAGMVLGISSIPTVFLGIGGIVGVVGLVLSAVGLKKGQSKGPGIAGLVTSIVGVVMGVLFVVLVVVSVVYSGIQTRVTDTQSQQVAASLAKASTAYQAEFGEYPSYEKGISIAPQYGLAYEDVDQVGPYGSTANVEYIACNGDGVLIWAWSIADGEYKETALGDTSNCQY